MADKICSICGKPFDDMYKMGNNAEPFHSGRCCDECNKFFVIPSREIAYRLRREIISLYNDTLKEIETGAFKLQYHKRNELGFRLKKDLSIEFKDWLCKYYVDLCKNDKTIKELEGQLISSVRERLKDCDDVYITYYTEGDNFIINLVNISLKHQNNE